MLTRTYSKATSKESHLSYEATHNKLQVVAHQKHDCHNHTFTAALLQIYIKKTHQKKIEEEYYCPLYISPQCAHRGLDVVVCSRGTAC